MNILYMPVSGMDSLFFIYYFLGESILEEFINCLEKDQYILEIVSKSSMECAGCNL